ncbi:zinc finger matrin-type protein 5-like [Cotesia glomerata]|nr:zinc finger matrin-type protein 5-like [Cotesia glomerata]
MGKRYYCDYCDRHFKDDSEARKKHLSSLQHINKHSQYYQQFKEPKDILKDEACKIPCKKFFTSGECAFGNNCKFSHYSSLKIQALEKIVTWRNQTQSEISVEDGRQAHDLINDYFQHPVLAACEQVIYPTWNITSALKIYENLSPSLSLILPQHITDSNFEKWGFKE